MRLVLFTHPEFLGLRSQANFARMLAEAYAARGHEVELRQPAAVLRRRVGGGTAAKWAGYVDQYLLFPLALRAALRRDPADTLYVVCDQALGPWVPQLARRPHVVHCHDLLALRSALGEIPEHPTGPTGRLYQRYIRRGFARARHFISVSRHSRDELHRVGGVRPVSSEVVYNGLNHPYRPIAPARARQLLEDAGLPVGERRCLLHVGAGQWYKNSVGVVALYGAYARDELQRGRRPLPLWLVSPPPDAGLRAAIDALPAGCECRFLMGLDAAALEALYSHAEALLFPSLAEGFGWPIAEALACGCPVLTTDAAPMTEVGGDCADYLPRLASPADLPAWADAGAQRLAGMLARDPDERARRAAAGCAWAARFDAAAAIDAYLAIYRRVLDLETAPHRGGIDREARPTA